MDQPEYGTNTSYLVDFIQITLSTKLLNNDQIKDFYLNQGLSAAQIGAHFGVAKSVIIGRLHDLGIRGGVPADRSANPNNYRCPEPPYGFAVKSGKLVPRKTELRTCRLVVELIRKGVSANGVAQELSKRGIKSRSGKARWGHGTILRINDRWKDKL